MRKLVLPEVPTMIGAPRPGMIVRLGRNSNAALLPRHGPEFLDPVVFVVCHVYVPVAVYSEILCA